MGLRLFPLRVVRTGDVKGDCVQTATDELGLFADQIRMLRLRALTLITV